MKAPYFLKNAVFLPKRLRTKEKMSLISPEKLEHSFKFGFQNYVLEVDLFDLDLQSRSRSQSAPGRNEFYFNRYHYSK